jgi:hypothetical protein
VDVTVDARLMRARRVAAQVDPAMHAVELPVQRPAAGIQRLHVTAPAVDKLMRSGGDPLVVVHASNITLLSWNRPSDRPVSSAIQILILIASGGGNL